MSTSRSAISRSCVAVAGLPLTQALLLACRSMVRLSSNSSPAGKPFSSSQFAREAGQSKVALISQRCAPSRTMAASARAPSASCRASIKMDLPAPVSPVSTVKPLLRSSSSAWTITKSRRKILFRLMKQCSLQVGCSLRPRLRSSAASCARCRSSSSRPGVRNEPGAQIDAR